MCDANLSHSKFSFFSFCKYFCCYHCALRSKRHYFFYSVFSKVLSVDPSSTTSISHFFATLLAIGIALCITDATFSSSFQKGKKIDKLSSFFISFFIY